MKGTSKGTSLEHSSRSDKGRMATMNLANTLEVENFLSMSPKTVSKKGAGTKPRTRRELYGPALPTWEYSSWHIEKW